MKILDEPFSGLKLLQPNVIHDNRGYFFESYQVEKLKSIGIDTSFVQDNEAFSTKYALRGLHYQVAPYGQAKLVRVVLGSVLDVAVDIRPWSDTYGQSYCVELSAENKMQLYIPRGFAHGYLVLSEEAIFAYKTDNFYHKSAEAGIRFDDPQLNIPWNVPHENLKISDKDLILPFLGDHTAYE
jgi:dTDP-4-dehydrorhamnose 3,5-epimerase